MNFQSIVHSLKLVTTDRPTDGPTDIAWYRAAIAAKNNASMFFTFIPRSQIYQDIFLPGWMFGSLGWYIGSLALTTAADFTCYICMKNKSQRQSPLTLGLQTPDFLRILGRMGL